MLYNLFCAFCNYYNQSNPNHEEYDEDCEYWFRMCYQAGHSLKLLHSISHIAYKKS